MNQKGFTLIELVMVIVILAILGAVAIPKYVDLQSEAKLGNEAAVAGAVRAGILTYFIDPARGNRLTYPDTLDAVVAPPDTPCAVGNACFTNILAQGGITEQWTKVNTNVYRSSATAFNYIWVYTPETGEFVKRRVPQEVFFPPIP